MIDLSQLSDEKLIILFAQEIRRRKYIGLVCGIPQNGDDSFFCGSYPKEWEDLESLPLVDQLLRLAAYASVVHERERKHVDPTPRSGSIM